MRHVLWAAGEHRSRPCAVGSAPHALSLDTAMVPSSSGEPPELEVWPIREVLVAGRRFRVLMPESGTPEDAVSALLDARPEDVKLVEVTRE